MWMRTGSDDKGGGRGSVRDEAGGGRDGDAERGEDG